MFSLKFQTIETICYLFTDSFLITKTLQKDNLNEIKLIKYPIKLDKIVLDKEVNKSK